jgi:hypothetical protein
MIDLLRCVMRLPTPMIDRLDQIAEDASVSLRCEVSRAAVLRAVVLICFGFVEGISREKLLETIRVSVVKRGRKRQ